MKIDDACLFRGEGNGTPLQCSCLENPMDGGAWWAIVHGVAKSWTQLSDLTFTFHFHALEEEMETLPSARRPWCARRRKSIFGGLHSGVSYSAVGWEFSVHEAKYGISKKKRKKPDDLYVRPLWKMQK